MDVLLFIRLFFKMIYRDSGETKIFHLKSKLQSNCQKENKQTFSKLDDESEYEVIVS